MNDKKKTYTLYGGRSTPYENVHVGDFHSYLKKTKKKKKNKLSILII